MLTLTESASALIKNLTDQTDVDTAGLRIAGAADDPNLSVGISPEPEEGDAVVEKAGARVFLEENAASLLDDKVLDAQLDDQGSVRFAIGEQRS